MRARGLAVAALVALPARADELYTRYFADVNGGKPCYARYCGVAH